MAGRLVGADFDALFAGFRHTAFRLETQRQYTVPEEREPYARFLAGEPVGSEWFEPWLNVVRNLTAEGRRMERVRVLDTPPTEYQRWELTMTPQNVAAGEIIHFLPRDDAERHGVPVGDGDWWLFDSSRLARMHFDPTGRPLGAEIITDPEIVVRHNEIRDLALHYATPFEQLTAA